MELGIPDSVLTQGCKSSHHLSIIPLIDGFKITLDGQTMIDASSIAKDGSLYIRKEKVSGVCDVEFVKQPNMAPSWDGYKLCK